MSLGPAVGLCLVCAVTSSSSWGLDVFRCDDAETLYECLTELRERPWFARLGVLAQELVSPQGHDLRLLIAANRVVGAAGRVAAPGEWRTNVSLGGQRVATAPPLEACRLGVRAAAAIGADLVGVDLLPLDHGFTVIELNGAADFNGQYSLPGRNVFRDAAEALGLLPSNRRDRTDRSEARTSVGRVQRKYREHGEGLTTPPGAT